MMRSLRSPPHRRPLREVAPILRLRLLATIFTDRRALNLLIGLVYEYTHVRVCKYTRMCACVYIVCIHVYGYMYVYMSV